MRQFNRALWWFIKPSWFTLLSISIISALFVSVFSFLGSRSIDISIEGSTLEISYSLLGYLMAILLPNIFFGWVFGLRLSSMKETYLWWVRKKMRVTVVAAFCLLVGLVTLPQVWVLKVVFSELEIFALAPFFITVFSAHMLVCEGMLRRVTVPLIPFLIFPLGLYSVSMMMLVLGIATAILVYGIYRGVPSRRSLVNHDMKKNNFSFIEFEIGLVDKVTALEWRFNQKRKSNLNWAFGPSVLVKSIFVAISLTYIMGRLAFGPLFFIKVPLLNLVFLAPLLFFEYSMSLSQLRSNSHVFSGRRHQFLKRYLLGYLDKTIILGAVLSFFFGLLLFSYLGAPHLLFPYWLIMLPLVMLYISLRSSFLVLNKVFSLFAVTLLFGVFVLYVIFYKYLVESFFIEGAFLYASLMSKEVMLFLIFCFLMRVFSVRMYLKGSVEQLFERQTWYEYF